MTPQQQSASTSSNNPGPLSPLGAGRQPFLSRVRSALNRPSPTQPPSEPPPHIDDALLRLAKPTDDLLTLFTTNAAQAGAVVHELASDKFLQTVASILEKLQTKKIATSVATLPQALQLNDALRRKNFTVLDWRANPLDALFDLDAAVTDVHAAIAETGSIVCSTDPGRNRSLSLLPPIHLAVVRKSDILPDQLDYWLKQKQTTAPNPIPSCTTFITGPSKTADIEGVLVTGVHGPREIHILLILDA